MCMCSYVNYPGMVRVSWISGYSDGGAVCLCPAHPCTVPGWSEYLGISGYSDGWGGGGCSVHVPIHVLSRDGQSISGSRDTLTGLGGGGGRVQCACAHPRTVLGWSVSCDLETL